MLQSKLKSVVATVRSLTQKSQSCCQHDSAESTTDHTGSASVQGITPRRMSSTVPRDICMSSLSVEATPIGEGSFCRVYGCTFEGRPAVVKVPKAGDPHLFKKACSMMQAEIELMEQLDHPNVVQLFGSGCNPFPFIVMERLDCTLDKLLIRSSLKSSSPGLSGGVLKRWRGRKTKIQQALAWGLDLANGMQYLHNASLDKDIVVHRDLKPSNCGISADGRMKIFDFGLSRVLDSTDRPCTARYHMTGGAGSLRYMAPEVARSEPYNQSVDVYSWAVIMNELFTSSRPYAGVKLNDFMARVVHAGERPPLSDLAPQQLRGLITRGWADSYAVRPDFCEITTRLQALQMGRPPYPLAMPVAQELPSGVLVY